MLDKQRHRFIGQIDAFRFPLRLTEKVLEKLSRRKVACFALFGVKGENMRFANYIQSVRRPKLF